MKIQFELETKDGKDVLAAYEIIFPLALKFSSNHMMKIMVPKNKSMDLGDK